jgi:hypothetical protein
MSPHDDPVAPREAPAAKSARRSAATEAASRTEFAVATRQFLQGQITLADSKAAVVLTVSAALVAYLIRSGRGTGPPMSWEPESLLTMAAFAALTAGIVGALAVVLPRFAGRGEGYVFWQAILSYETPEDYAKEVLGLDARAIEATLLEDCHRLSSICLRKFRVLRWAMWLAGLGLLLGLTRVLLFR